MIWKDLMSPQGPQKRDSGEVTIRGGQHNSCARRTTMTTAFNRYRKARATVKLQTMEQRQSRRNSHSLRGEITRARISRPFVIWPECHKIRDGSKEGSNSVLSIHCADVRQRFDPCVRKSSFRPVFELAINVTGLDRLRACGTAKIIGYEGGGVHS